MSIETEIKKLTAAIDMLTKAVVDSVSPQFQLEPVTQFQLGPVTIEAKEEKVVETLGTVIEREKEAKEETPVHIDEEAAKEGVLKVSHADVKTQVLALNRADKGNKVKLKALLASYDVTKVADILECDLGTIMDQLEKGDF